MINCDLQAHVLDPQAKLVRSHNLSRYCEKQYAFGPVMLFSLYFLFCPAFSLLFCKIMSYASLRMLVSNEEILKLLCVRIVSGNQEVIGRPNVMDFIFDDTLVILRENC